MKFRREQDGLYSKLEERKFSKHEVADIFSVPVERIGDASMVTGPDQPTWITPTFLAILLYGSKRRWALRQFPIGLLIWGALGWLIGIAHVVLHLLLWRGQ